MKERKKVWQMEEKLHPLAESYTVGEDYILDGQLIPYDIRASEAHAYALADKGVLSKKELRLLLKGLREILSLWKKGDFPILPEQEDGHTAIEHYLTEKYGEIGKKIHTGRSRNDQVLVMMRLFMKEKLAEAQGYNRKVVAAFKQYRSDKTPMPGYTHMQKAMPTTIGAWFTSYADAFDDIRFIIAATLKTIDQNPLGSASGFGISNFTLNRTLTTQFLEFSKTQKNPLYCGFSRGYFEELALSALSPAMLIAGRFATDMMLFTMDSFNFFSLPISFTTGSSIMPQKRNYDVFEIMRGNAKVFEAKRREIRDIISTLGSGYHRDLQLTKKPFLEAVTLYIHTMQILIELLPRITINTAALESAMTDDLFVTEEVYDLVNGGMSFRDAYRKVKNRWNKGRKK